MQHTWLFWLTNGDAWQTIGMLVYQPKILTKNRTMVCRIVSVDPGLFYQLTTPLGITLHQVTLQLAAEEARELERGEIRVHETSPLCFLQQGLELEESQ